jgi:hypothetical protein
MWQFILTAPMVKMTRAAMSNWKPVSKITMPIITLCMMIFPAGICDIDKTVRFFRMAAAKVDILQQVVV